MLSVFLLVLRVQTHLEVSSCMCLRLESFLRQLESFRGKLAMETLMLIVTRRFAVTLQSLHLTTLEGQLMHSNIADSSIYHASMTTT